jgi:hypothetical protein
MSKPTIQELRISVLAEIICVQIALDNIKREINNGNGIGLSLPAFDKNSFHLGCKIRDLKSLIISTKTN